ncbi:MAG: hypothetical protein EZS28_005206 [Streblomastix strix]|uniref:Uncharacterized protein n=1 Tax=Streblomastix strix TaxID=222440 RepID=A0A5J4WYI4_9EUKA|nr:MAG: hypothetical protein EZS28_005206 [Streblomastix strix]
MQKSSTQRISQPKLREKPGQAATINSLRSLVTGNVSKPRLSAPVNHLSTNLGINSNDLPSTMDLAPIFYVDITPGGFWFKIFGRPNPRTT